MEFERNKNWEPGLGLRAASLLILNFILSQFGFVCLNLNILLMGEKTKDAKSVKPSL